MAEPRARTKHVVFVIGTGVVMVMVSIAQYIEAGLLSWGEFAMVEYTSERISRNA
jgi:hypothetical protein